MRLRKDLEVSLLLECSTCADIYIQKKGVSDPEKGLSETPTPSSKMTASRREKSISRLVF